jgi:2-methylisocitrate lyase-like PEP mutase family enzyme
MVSISPDRLSSAHPAETILPCREFSMTDVKAARQRFKAMHSDFFVIPNAWSVGEIRQLEKLGFGAVATTSAGLSMSMGRDDLSLSREETLQNIRTLCAATALPVNADFEAGFSDTADGVGTNVAMAVEAGVSGVSIEDRKGGVLYDLKDAVSRIKAARAAIDKIDPNIVLVGRSEGYLIGNSDVNATVERLKAYADAGADVLYAPGTSTPNDIEVVVKAVAPKPVNVLIIRPDMSAKELKSLGVKRMSIGGFLAVAAAHGFAKAAEQLKKDGTLPKEVFG